ncbi:hypothetical protein SLS62_003344 [Diatrype stigma]|uniref:Major facilitator superfamily (MFS) profile domain-containing protein n=1 Tax=Diatrype stigma TaxID=117547 RepID=A0AAN9V599_9PEZI
MATQTITELQTFEHTSATATLDAAAAPYVATPPSRKSHGPPVATAEAPPSPSPPSASAAGSAAAAAVADGTTPEAETAAISRPRGILIIAQLMGVSLLSSFSGGAVVVGLPAIAAALQLERDGLLLWPTSVFYLTAGSCLLLAGSVADVAGPKRANLSGALLGAACALGCGLARTGGQLIALRALQGVANAVVFPSSVSLVARHVEGGRPRNMGFACLGFAAPIGFSLGLVLGGVFVDGAAGGWRAAFYLAGTASFALFVVGIWALPPDGARSRPGRPSVWKRLVSDIDWVGAVLASTGLATLSYVFA